MDDEEKTAVPIEERVLWTIEAKQQKGKTFYQACLEVADEAELPYMLERDIRRAALASITPPDTIKITGL